MTGKNIKQVYKLANRTSEILARPMPTTVGVLPAQLSEDDRKNFRKLYLLIEQLLANPVLTENPAIVTELQSLATGLPEIDTTDLVVVDRFEPEDNIVNVANIASLARESISPAPSFSEITVYDSEDDNIDFRELIKSVQRFKLDDDDESYCRYGSDRFTTEMRLNTHSGCSISDEYGRNQRA
ncbi:hypothetical protein ACMFMG_010981 [Clarireedia jacksonii]